MKKTILGRLLGCLITTLFLYPVFCQSNVVAPYGNFKTPTKVVEPITEKALLSFQKSFKEAEDVYWTAFPNKYVVGFKIGDQKAQTHLNKKGTILQTVYFGTEKLVPEAEKKLINTDYEDYDIVNAEHIILPGESFWFVYLQNCTQLVKVQILDGELYEVQRLKNQSKLQLSFKGKQHDL